MNRGRILPWVLFVISACSSLWLVMPSVALGLAERRLNALSRGYRPFAYRWPGAPNAPLSSHQIPAEHAGSIRGLISFAERYSSRTARSIRLTGRLEALSGRADLALSALRLAYLLEPDDASTLSELGSAYARRAIAEKRAADFAPALDAVVWAVSQAPDSPIATFNAAVVFDEFPLPRQADLQWADAIRTEPDGPWRQEAASRRSAWPETLRKRTGISARLTADPASIASVSQPGAAELAIATALDEWLPNRSQWRAQLTALAAMLEQKHADPWLTDLLRLPESPAATEALLALSDAWRANSAGEHVRAAQRAADAERRFHALSNPAGEQRARLEYVMALHREGKSGACLKALDGMLEATRRRSYQWLHGQAWLDLVTCLGQERRVDVVEERERAYRWIRSTGYQGLELRSLGFLIEQQVGLGNPLRVWERGHEGVLAYWNGVLPPLRVHPLYYSLAQSAYSWDYPFAALALVRESVLALEQTKNRQLLGLVLSRLGYYEAAAGLRRNAGATYSRAADVFSMDPAESRLLRGLAEIQIAEGDTLAGQPESALTRLRRLPPFQYGSYAQLFVRPALGNALLRANRLAEATAEFQQAIAENEQHRETLNNPSQREASNREVATAYRGLTQASLMRRDVVGALETWQRFRAGPARGATADALAVGTGMLVSAFLPRGLALWLADKDGVIHHWADAGLVRAAADRLAEVAADPGVPKQVVTQAAGVLAGLILEPFHGRLAAVTTLLIDADGPLARVPWPVLPREHGENLIERTALVQIHGRPSAAGLKAVQFDGTLILADPDLGSELAEVYPRLLDARREAEWLHSRLPTSLLLTGSEVNLDAVTSRVSGRHVLHFAGHGVSHGGFGAILVAEGQASAPRGRLVTSEQLANADLSGVDLVFLAACSTGSGESFGAANPDSLVNAFLQAGSSRVVAARWNVSSRPTRHIVETFYGFLLDSVPPAEALRRAMLSVSHKPAFAHPYYWAGFQVFGAP